MLVQVLSVVAHPWRLAGLGCSYGLQGDADLSTSFAGVLQPACPTREENMGTTSMLEETAVSPVPSRNTGSVTPFETFCRLSAHEQW